jgi:hypothetical protein
MTLNALVNGLSAKKPKHIALAKQVLDNFGSGTMFLAFIVFDIISKGLNDLIDLEEKTLSKKVASFVKLNNLDFASVPQRTFYHWFDALGFITDGLCGNKKIKTDAEFLKWFSGFRVKRFQLAFGAIHSLMKIVSASETKQSAEVRQLKIDASNLFEACHSDIDAQLFNQLVKDYKELHKESKEDSDNRLIQERKDKEQAACDLLSSSDDFAHLFDSDGKAKEVLLPTKDNWVKMYYMMPIDEKDESNKWVEVNFGEALLESARAIKLQAEEDLKIRQAEAKEKEIRKQAYMKKASAEADKLKRLEGRLSNGSISEAQFIKLLSIEGLTSEVSVTPKATKKLSTTTKRQKNGTITVVATKRKAVKKATKRKAVKKAS